MRTLRTSFLMILILLSIIISSASLAQAELLRRDDFRDVKSWWFWYSLCTDSPWVYDGVLHLYLASATGAVECGSGIGAAGTFDNIFGNYTAIMRIKTLTPMHPGTRGWGFWDFQPPWPGDLSYSDICWFMEQSDPFDPARTWWLALTRNEAAGIISYTGLEPLVDQDEWHTYRIERRPGYVSFYVDDVLVHYTDSVVPEGLQSLHIWIDNFIYPLNPSDPFTTRAFTEPSALVVDFVEIYDGQLGTSEPAAGSLLLKEMPNETGSGESNYLWKEYTFNSQGGKNVVLITARAESYADFSDDDDIRIVLDALDLGWDTATSFNGDMLNGENKTLVYIDNLEQGQHSLDVHGDTTPILYDVTVIGAANGDIILNEELNEQAPGGNDYLWKEYSFDCANDEEVSIFISGSAHENTGDDDDIRIILDGEDLGWDTDYSFSGDRLYGEAKALVIRRNLSTGNHTLQIYADETPILHNVLIYGSAELLQGNKPPVLDPIGDKSVNENEPLTFTITATDPDGDSLTYSASNLPPGATFDPATQQFNWTPDWQSSGGYRDIVFSVSDGNIYDQETITIDVIDKSPLEAPAGLTVILNINSVTLTWNSIDSSELAGYNIYRSTSSTGAFVKLNHLPIIDTQYIDYDVESGVTYHYFVTAVDVFDQVELFSETINRVTDIVSNNEGQLFVTTWTNGTIWTIDHEGVPSIYATGFVTTACLTFHNQDLFVTDYDGGAIYRITPQKEIYPYAESVVLAEPYGLVFDANGDLFVSEDLNGTILKISDNGASSELFFEGLDGPGAMTVDDSGKIYVGEDIWEGTTPAGVIDIFDIDQNKQVLANLTDPDGIFLAQSGDLYVGESHINQVTRVMPDGTSMPVVVMDSGPWGCIINKFGELLVTLPWDGQIMKVHLSHESDISNKVSVTVPTSNNPPVLDPIGNKTINEGEPLSFTVTATDPDNDNLTFSASSLPPGATFDPATQLFSWTPQANQAGTYQNVLFTVTDDGTPALTDSETITITVGDVNRPPVLDPIGNKTINEGEPLSFTVTATDPDNDNLTFSASSLPPGATFDPATQLFSWTPQANQAGTYQNVLFTVTDDGTPALTDSETITITVGDVNRPPVLDPIGNKTINEGEPLSFTVTATDPDNDNLTFSASSLPPGATFDPATQLFSWTPQANQAGTYQNVLFTVTDDGTPALTDSETITITCYAQEVEVIVDTADGEFSTVGTWVRSSDPLYPYYGSGFHYSLPGTGENYAVFRPDLPVSGDFEVFIWYATTPVGSTNQPFTINHNGGSATVPINFRGGASSADWLSLGVFPFGQGTSGSVITSNNTDSYAGADAVRWVLVQP